MPQPGKEKSRVICEAFAAGCGGSVREGLWGAGEMPMFYGVVGLEEYWRVARRRGSYIYGDNAFFDVARGTHFRFARDALQAEPKKPAWARLQQLGVEIKPWRRDGGHVVVVAQSAHFMREVAGWPGGVLAWQEHVTLKLKQYTDRLIDVRHWSRDKTGHAASLRKAFDGAWAVVTHASAAANEALLDGIPVFVTGQCAALPMGLSQLEQVEYPRRPDGRHEWAACLAGAQWTLDEVKDGLAWKALND